jgi:hypothetical protein
MLIRRAFGLRSAALTGACAAGKHGAFERSGIFPTLRHRSQYLAHQLTGRIVVADGQIDSTVKEMALSDSDLKNLARAQKALKNLLHHDTRPRCRGAKRH